MPDSVAEDNRPHAPEPSGDGGVTVFFWPILIFMIATCVSAAYQIALMQDQLHAMRRAAAEQEPKVRQAQYEKDKLYRLAGDIMDLSATDPLAQQIVTEHNIQRIAPGDLPPDDVPAR